MLGTVTFQIRGHTLIETLRGKNPMKIHSALSEVYGKFTVDHSTVFRWANRFRDGCVSIDNEPRPEKPRTSKEERSS